MSDDDAEIHAMLDRFNDPADHRLRLQHVTIACFTDRNVRERFGIELTLRHPLISEPVLHRFWCTPFMLDELVASAIAARMSRHPSNQDSKEF
jgi:hypothetical protein